MKKTVKKWQTSHEGFRDVNDPQIIIVTNQYNSKAKVDSDKKKAVSPHSSINIYLQVSCESHNFCAHDNRMMDV